MIIGLGGGFCSGKTMVQDYLTLKHNVYQHNFATKLKQIAEDLFGMKEKDRTLLQDIGMAMRNIREDVWVDYVMNHAKINSHINISIGDVRYDNEINAIHKHPNAITIFIERDPIDRYTEHEKLYGHFPTFNQVNHPSEQLDPWLFTYKVKNNGTPEELYTKIDKIIKPLL